MSSCSADPGRLVWFCFVGHSDVLLAFVSVLSMLLAAAIACLLCRRRRRAQVPEDEVKLEEELVHCVMVLLNKPQGLMTLEASSDLLPLLAVRLREKKESPAA